MAVGRDFEWWRGRGEGEPGGEGWTQRHGDRDLRMVHPGTVWQEHGP